MANISQIRTALKTKLDSLTTPAVVSDSFDLNQAGNPKVIFEPSSLGQETLDNCNNLRSYFFTIVIEQEAEKKTRAEALNIMIEVFDELINAIDKDYTLGGFCEGGVKPITGDFGVAVSEKGDIMFIKFELECKTVYNLNT